MPIESISSGPACPTAWVTRPPLDARHESLAGPLSEQLGVLDPDRGGSHGLVDDDDADTHGPGERAPADLVHAGEEPVTGTLELPFNPEGRLLGRSRTSHDHPQEEAARRSAAVGAGDLTGLGVGASAPSVGVVAPGTGVLWEGAGTSWKVRSGTPSHVTWSMGQTMNSARPTILSMGTEPSDPSLAGPSWYLRV